jgi:hypothetical protein
VAEIRVEVGPPGEWMSPDYDAAVHLSGRLTLAAEDAQVTSFVESAQSPRYLVNYLVTTRSIAGTQPPLGVFRLSGRPSVILRNEQRDIVGGVADPSAIEVDGSDRFELDMTAESETFPFFSGALVEVYVNDISIEEVRHHD